MSIDGQDGRRRVVIEAVSPQIDGGEFPAKRVIGEDVVVEADVLCDGHDVLAAEIRFRREGRRSWSESPMRLVDNGNSVLVQEASGFRPHTFLKCAFADEGKKMR